MDLLFKMSSRVRLAVIFCVSMIVAGAYAVVPSVAGATGLGTAFEPKEVGEELLEKLGPVGVAVVAIFVAVFLFTVGLHFFRRHGKSMAK
ncbi:MAG: hypothetical protein WAN65_10170 [Candidatus Sulfotelmatobacter sp.]